MLAWDTELYLGHEDEFAVVEHIRWDFEGESSHGILRDIPVAYGRGRAADYRIRIDDIEVMDAEGRARPWRTSETGRVLEIKIGDPNRTVSGVEDYEIHYRVRRGLLFFEGHDELYWNAIGGEVLVPIESARVTVYLPDGLDPARGAAGLLHRARRLRRAGVPGDAGRGRALLRGRAQARAARGALGGGGAAEGRDPRADARVNVGSRGRATTCRGGRRCRCSRSSR